MNQLDRRDLFSGALVGAAAAALSQSGSADEAVSGEAQPPWKVRPWKVIDTNISLFQWPFRRLPYDALDPLVEKLGQLRIDQAWAASYEGVLQRDIAGVNLRLAEACRTQRKGLLVPFGSVNLELPDWEEDLRRCREEHAMPGIRLHPNYHGYTLDDPRFERLLFLAAEQRLLVQIAVTMEDQRTQHPKLRVPDVDLAPLPDLMRKVPAANVLLLNFRPTGTIFSQLVATPRVYFDTARAEATDGIARLSRSTPPDRVVFGTHAPFLIYESALIRVYESDLTLAEHRAVFEQNAKQLLATSS